MPYSRISVKINRVCFGDGLGGFTSPCSDVSADTNSSFGIALGFIDGDTDLDAVFANNNQINRVCLGDGSGGFTCSNVSADTNQSVGVAIAEAIGVTTVDIDIKPGSDPNSINLGSAGVVPLAILSSATFDATDVDPDTISLAGAKVKMVGKSDKSLCGIEDVNDDGLDDLVCKVETAQFMVEPGDSMAVLEAEIFGGQPIRGEDSIRIVPE